MRYILVFFTLLFSLPFYAQTEMQPVAIYTKDGNVLRGKIIAKIPGESLELELNNGQRITINQKNIHRIFGKNDRHILLPDGTTFRTGGFYKNYHIQTMYGGSSTREGDNTVILGIGTQFTAGWQFNQYLAVGGTLGLSHYGNALGDLSLNIRGELSKKKISPTYALDAGYGALVSLNALDETTWVNRGGLLFRPSIGLRIANHKRSNLLIDAGYALQQFYSKNDRWNGSSDIRQGWFRRASIRIGWTW